MPSRTHSFFSIRKSYFACGILWPWIGISERSLSFSGDEKKDFRVPAGVLSSTVKFILSLLTDSARAIYSPQNGSKPAVKDSSPASNYATAQRKRSKAKKTGCFGPCHEWEWVQSIFLPWICCVPYIRFVLRFWLSTAQIFFSPPKPFSESWKHKGFFSFEN